MLPTLYESGHISIQTLWVFVAIALLSASYLAVERLKRARVDFVLFIKHRTSLLLFALIGSRFVFFFFHTDTYFPAFDLRTLYNFIAIWDQGLSFWGAEIGFAATLTFHLLKAKENLWKWFDALIVPLLVGLAIGNIGAFLGGYSYGTPSNLPWAVRYELYNVKYTVPIHPTQLYVILFIILALLSLKKLKNRSHFFEQEGNTSLFLVSALSFIFFLLEFLRGDDTLLIFGTRFPIFLFALLFLFSGTKLGCRYHHFKLKSHGPIEAP